MKFDVTYIRIYTYNTLHIHTHTHTQYINAHNIHIYTVHTLQYTLFEAATKSKFSFLLVYILRPFSPLEGVKAPRSPLLGGPLRVTAFRLSVYAYRITTNQNTNFFSSIFPCSPLPPPPGPRFMDDVEKLSRLSIFVRRFRRRPGHKFFFPLSGSLLQNFYYTAQNGVKTVNALYGKYIQGVRG